MRIGQNAVFNALERSQGFLDDNAAALSGVDFTAARKRLDEVVNSFSSHAFDQDTGERGAKGETAKQLQLRLKLRSELMEPIAVIARRNLRSVAEFKGIDGSRPDRTLGWSSHAIGQMVRFGVAVMDAARTSAPAARDIRMLLNAHDHTVSRRRNLELAGRWASSGGNVAAWEFRDALQLPHDFVDPGERSANIAATHPVIRALIDGKEPASNAVYQLHLEQELSVPLEAEVLSAAEDPNTHR